MNPYKSHQNRRNDIEKIDGSKSLLVEPNEVQNPINVYDVYQ